MAMTGSLTGDTMLAAAVLVANLFALAVAVAELREAQQLGGKRLRRVPLPGRSRRRNPEHAAAAACQAARPDAPGADRRYKPCFR